MEQNLLIEKHIEQLLAQENFSLTGISKFAQPVSFAFYQQWLDKNYHGDMDYLARHLAHKQDPQTHFAFAKSAIVVAVNYLPHPKPLQSSLRIAHYAQGEDYHLWLPQRLDQLAQKLKAIFPQEVFFTATDSSPILERDLAQQAGIGWFGKNTCLIHPKKGSLFVLGEILTSLDLQANLKPVPDFCGTCQKCLEICPTQAFVAPRVLDARKCISYLTIESKSIPDVQLREKISDWFFGCDLCQTVCPWNQKVFQKKLEVRRSRIPNSEERTQLIAELRFVLSASGKALMKFYAKSPLNRARPFGLKRNALIVVANQNLQELHHEVLALKQNPRLAELADWCLDKLQTQL